MKHGAAVLLVSAATVLATATSASLRADTEPDVWAAVVPLVGEWRGEGSGFGAVSDVDHDWSFAVQGKFLQLRTRSVQRAEAGAGEVHEDIGYLSFDQDAGAFVFRQFLSEGLVNTFDVEVDGQTIWFHHRLSESAGGMRARMQLRFLSEDEYEMVLDLAAPGKEFAACQEMRLKRVR